MATYDIRPLQLRILDILTAVDEVCRQHNLRYYLWAGTMLGAVRHRGFIPWDDDLDIAMPRADYDLLMKHAAEWVPKPYEVVAYETDKSYPLPFAKIQDSSTTLIERQHIQYMGGIYMDVFPLDGMTNNKLVQRWHFAKYFYWKKIQYYITRDPYRHGHGPSSWIPLICRKCYTLAEVQQRMRELQTQYSFDYSTHVVDHDDGLSGVMPRQLLGTPKKVVFEGVEVMGVEHSDEYLKQKYGNYMQIPKGNHQRQHNFYLLDLENSYHHCVTS